MGERSGLMVNCGVFMCLASSVFREEIGFNNLIKMLMISHLQMKVNVEEI